MHILFYVLPMGFQNSSENDNGGDIMFFHNCRQPIHRATPKKADERGGGGTPTLFFPAAPSVLTIFKRKIRDSDILTSKKKKKKGQQIPQC